MERENDGGRKGGLFHANAFQKMHTHGILYTNPLCKHMIYTSQTLECTLLSSITNYAYLFILSEDIHSNCKGVTSQTEENTTSKHWRQ